MGDSSVPTICTVPITASNSSSSPNFEKLLNSYLIFATLYAEDLPERWFVTNTNSTRSPGCNFALFFTCDEWKNNFRPSSTTYDKNPY